jgi:RNA polymerase sigma-70 factor (ECF subfamily)
MGASKEPFGGDGRVVEASGAQSRRLYVIARRAGDEEAADVVQDALLKSCEAGRTAEIAKPEHLLMRIARNLVIDRLRAKRRRQALFRPEPEIEVADGAPSPERALIAVERLRRALSAIDDMPPKRREVFTLHRFEELSYLQIARRLGISIKTIEKHMTLAMAQLSREIDRG